jgi:hypothetical protein
MGPSPVGEAGTSDRGCCELLHKGVFNTGNRAYDQVYTLEKVLKIKKDPITQTEFLDDVMKVSSCQPRRIMTADM